MEGGCTCTARRAAPLSADSAADLLVSDSYFLADQVDSLRKLSYSHSRQGHAGRSLCHKYAFAGLRTNGLDEGMNAFGHLQVHLLMMLNLPLGSSARRHLRPS